MVEKYHFVHIQWAWFLTVHYHQSMAKNLFPVICRRWYLSLGRIPRAPRDQGRVAPRVDGYQPGCAREGLEKGLWILFLEFLDSTKCSNRTYWVVDVDMTMLIAIRQQ